MSAERQGLVKRICSTRDGKLNDSEFGRRMRGVGPIADQIAQIFKVFAKKYGLDRKMPPLDTSKFRHPRPGTGQLKLF